MRNKSQHGISLIEVLIALGIGALLLLGATALFINNKRIYKENDEMGRLQENARFAMEILTRDIRMSGYVGCSSSIDNLSNHLPDSSGVEKINHFRYPIEGINDINFSTSRWKPSNANPNAAGENLRFRQLSNNTDAITLRYLQPITSQVSFTANATMASKTANIPVSCALNDCSSFIKANQKIAISDCGTTDLFQVNAVNPTSIKLSSGITLSKIYSHIDGAQISRYTAARYFIRPSQQRNSSNQSVPSLWRFTAASQAKGEEIIQGVENMQIMYGIDNNFDGVDNYYDADDPAMDWDNIVSVKIMLLLRTINPNPQIEEDKNTYQLLNAAVYDPVDESIRRRVFSSIIKINNRNVGNL